MACKLLAQNHRLMSATGLFYVFIPAAYLNVYRGDTSTFGLADPIPNRNLGRGQLDLRQPLTATSPS